MKYRRFRVTDYRQIRQGDYLNTWQVGGRTVCEVSRPIVEPDVAQPTKPTTSALDALIVFAYIMGGIGTIMLTAAICVGALQ